MNTFAHENEQLRAALKRIIERCEIFIDDEAELRKASIEILMGIAEDALSQQAQPDDNVLFGYADRSVRVSQEAYAIILDRERALDAQVKALGDEVELLKLSQPEAGRMQGGLWAVHAQGPDELYAAFSREDAEQHAAALNSLSMPAGIQVAAVVIPSPWPAAEHWKYAAELERDHATELKALATRHAQPEQSGPVQLLVTALERLGRTPGCGCGFPCRCGGDEWTRDELEGRIGVATVALSAYRAALFAQGGE